MKLNKLHAFYTAKNRWWLPLLAGLPFAVTQPPFNHEFHWLFSLFPLLSFMALLPLLYFAVQKPAKRAMVHTFLCAYTMAIGQCFWVAFVHIQGLWAIIIVGMFLLAAFVALFFLAAALLFRILYYRLPQWYMLLFPAFWVLIDYMRTLSDLSFPWGFLGYNFTAILPLSQTASLTGVWGLTFLIVVVNTLLFDFIKSKMSSTPRPGRRPGISLVAIAGVLAILTIWGVYRMSYVSSDRHSKKVKIALIQPNLDQLNWGNYSLTESFSIFDTLIRSAAAKQPDVIIGPESSLLCYLSRQSTYKRHFQHWADSTHIPVILGALHWDKAPGGSIYDYLVYNTAFMATPGEKDLSLYRKIMLVPFSEAFPFEADVPILSRVNLGEADFKRGNEEVVFTVDSTIHAAMYICYEAVFPSFVQRRLKKEANLIVHITNDGWFGNTSGPYQHAEMARMRTIENGVPMARCAITGISMFIDAAGRITQKTRLDERLILSQSVALRRADSLYSRFGDWFVVVCGMVAAGTFILLVIKGKRARKV